MVHCHFCKQECVKCEQDKRNKSNGKKDLKKPVHGKNGDWYFTLQIKQMCMFHGRKVHGLKKRETWDWSINESINQLLFVESKLVWKSHNRKNTQFTHKTFSCINLKPWHVQSNLLRRTHQAKAVEYRRKFEENKTVSISSTNATFIKQCTCTVTQLHTTIWC